VPCSSAFNHQHPSGCLCDECGVAEALSLLLDGIALWRHLHLIIAKEFIGNLPGTGGTIGYKYLEKRIEHDSAESQQSFYAKKASQLPAETSPEITLNHMWAWLNSIEDRIRRLQSLKSL
ncbi:MAG: hypothetical protein JO235_00365, partial [Chroococcidiopsidaceae cyanobacterium CP_BM_RX_35]|nr:hypothetical protein [Chroococcidiopsidaceae cyanobacterium CP_BM_RX_35]